MYLKINLQRGFLVSPQDLYLLEQYPFHETHGYAITTIGNKQVYLHKLILTDACRVDHKNRNGLDNRRENLRYVTQSQNNMNRSKNTLSTSGYKGVHKNGNSWSASIKIKGKKLHLGTYITKEEAALQYNKAALKHFGEFACINQLI